MFIGRCLTAATDCRCMCQDRAHTWCCASWCFARRQLNYSSTSRCSCVVSQASVSHFARDSVVVVAKGNHSVTTAVAVGIEMRRREAPSEILCAQAT